MEPFFAVALGQQAIFGIMANSQTGFISAINQIAHSHEALVLVANDSVNHLGDSIMHVAILKFLSNPFYLEYLLNTSMPLNTANS